MAKLFLGAALLAAACSGPKAPPAEHPGAMQSAPSADSGAGPEAADSPPLDEAECRAIIDHYLEVFMTEKRAEEPAEHLPTEAQVAEIREQLYAEAQTGCVGSPRTGYDCAMEAESSSAIGACLPKEKDAP